MSSVSPPPPRSSRSGGNEFAPFGSHLTTGELRVLKALPKFFGPRGLDAAGLAAKTGFALLVVQNYFRELSRKLEVPKEGMSTAAEVRWVLDLIRTGVATRALSLSTTELKRLERDASLALISDG